MNTSHIPLSLYIHYPWCLKKCAYCDFYSSQQKPGHNDQLYLDNLLAQLDTQLPFVQNREIISIFMGGGTPSLLSGEIIEKLLTAIQKKLSFSNDCEITLEANPETLTEEKLNSFLLAGINRLSIGIQSFSDRQLEILGRIHSAQQCRNVIAIAKQAGFKNINLDLMHGLPNQTLDDAMDDLEQAIALSPQHISWYELTIEENTPFGNNAPPLPTDDDVLAIQQSGKVLLSKNGFQQYEVSAYAKSGFQCRHNLNYWQFGDYLGLGAGAHGKLTDTSTTPFTIYRFEQDKKIKCTPSEIITDFMLNALRLTEGFPLNLFETRTGISLSTIQKPLNIAEEMGFLKTENDFLSPTTKGKQYLNNCLELFV